MRKLQTVHRRDSSFSALSWSTVPVRSLRGKDRGGMSELSWTKLLLVLMLELQPTAVAAQVSSIIIKDGGDVMLPCENLIPNQNKCDSTNWICKCSGKIADLVTSGTIRGETADRSDRLSIADNCSLFIKKVTAADSGRYDCQQFRKGNQQVADALVYLSAVKITEEKVDDEVTLTCSVSVHELMHTVQCVHQDQAVQPDDIRMDAAQSKCYVTFSSSYVRKRPNYHQTFKCEVIDYYSKKLQTFTFSPEPSDPEIMTTKPTKDGDNTSGSNTADPGPTSQNWWLYAGVAVGVAALLLSTVAVFTWRRQKGSKAKMSQNTGHRLNPMETESGPAISQDKAEPEDAVSYASVSYTRKNVSKAEVGDPNDDDGDAVTYSTVKGPSVAAGASDPSNVYATVNKTKHREDTV